VIVQSGAARSSSGCSSWRRRSVRRSPASCYGSACSKTARP